MSAFGLYRSAFGKVLATAAIPLFPALIVISGAVVFGLSHLGAVAPAESEARTPEIQERRRDALASGDLDQHHQVAKEALQPADVTARVPARILPIAYVSAVVALLLLIGLSLAEAALVPLVASGGALRPSEAWAAVGERIGPLCHTCLVGALLVAVGSIFLVLPGLVAAVAFSFAIPVTLLEGLSGRAALERSLQLMQGRWGRVVLAWIGILAIGAAGTLLASLLAPGIGRMLIVTSVRVLLLPLPLIAIVLAYLDAAPQYMRRISAPG